ncbi:hypothetical protein F511_15274 [Dorcoceras hygrometricum]|uniref:Uncharacterized protein n=1 Tax=Dorcoceras hygrometricum TaxID=472368 RepID=A0A2Z7ALG1_9LAMI|nr:hypothetical protein F511_15274 [Dorcoceras hygrometricum]
MGKVLHPLLLSLQLIYTSATQPQKLQFFAPKSIQVTSGLLFSDATSNPTKKSLKNFLNHRRSIGLGGAYDSYSVVIKTRCSSTSRTRDRVSIAFGDAYVNEVYAPRLDDSRSGTFERCSTDTFQIRGPCTYTICYVYLLRVGSDGWKPESVILYSQDRKAATYYYNTFLANGMWYGFDHCKAGAAVSFDQSPAM